MINFINCTIEYVVCTVHVVCLIWIIVKIEVHFYWGLGVTQLPSFVSVLPSLSSLTVTTTRQDNKG